MPEWTRETAQTSGTRPQEWLRDLLEGVGYYVEDERQFGPYLIDCYVSELHAGFEADGELFHRTKGQRARDAERDHWLLTEAGVPVFRASAASLDPSGDGVQRLTEDVIKFCDNWFDNVASRREHGQENGHE